GAIAIERQAEHEIVETAPVGLDHYSKLLAIHLAHRARWYTTGSPRRFHDRKGRCRAGLCPWLWPPSCFSRSPARSRSAATRSRGPTAASSAARATRAPTVTPAQTITAATGTGLRPT